MPVQELQAPNSSSSSNRSSSTTTRLPGPRAPNAPRDHTELPPCEPGHWTSQRAPALCAAVQTLTAARHGSAQQWGQSLAPPVPTHRNPTTPPEIAVQPLHQYQIRRSLGITIPGQNPILLSSSSSSLTRINFSDPKKAENEKEPDMAKVQLGNRGSIQCSLEGEMRH